MLRLHSHMLEFPLMKVLLESLNNGQCVFLLDALDQAGRAYSEELGKVIRIGGLLKNNAVIITGRTGAFGEWGSTLQGYEVFRIEPFREEQIEEYLGKGVREEIEKIPYADVRELLKQPILLSMLKGLYSDNKEKLKNLRSRGQLYMLFMEHLLQWSKERLENFPTELHYSLHPNRVLAWLGRLSYLAACQDEWGIVSSNTLDRLLHEEEGLQEHLPWLTKWGIITEIWEGSKSGDLLFRHRSFQEFLAAWYIVNLLDYPRIIEKRYLDRKWEQTIFFASELLTDQKRAALSGMYAGKKEYARLLDALKWSGRCPDWLELLMEEVSKYVLRRGPAGGLPGIGLQIPFERVTTFQEKFARVPTELVEVFLEKVIRSPYCDRRQFSAALEIVRWLWDTQRSDWAKKILEEFRKRRTLSRYSYPESCYFCRRGTADIDHFLARTGGPIGIYICNECVISLTIQFNDIATTVQRCIFCGEREQPGIAIDHKQICANCIGGAWAAITFKEYENLSEIPQKVLFLLNLLCHKDHRYRWAGLMAVKFFADQSILGNDSVQNAIIDVIDVLIEQFAEPPLTTWVEVCERIGEPLVHRLLISMESSKPFIRAFSAIALARIRRHPKCSHEVDSVAKLLEDEHEVVRIHAIYAMAILRAVSKLDRIRTLSENDPSAEVREAAQHVCRQMKKCELL